MQNKEYNELVEEFRRGNLSRSRETYIIKTIEKKWVHLMLKKVRTLPEKDQEDFWQIYRMRILKAMDDWKGSAMFTTYLCKCVSGTLREYLWTNHKDQYKATQLIMFHEWDRHDLDTIHKVFSCKEWGTYGEDEAGHGIFTPHTTTSTLSQGGSD